MGYVYARPTDRTEFESFVYDCRDAAGAELRKQRRRARRFAWWTLGLTIAAFTVPVLGAGCAFGAIVAGVATLNALLCARIAALELVLPP